LIQQNFIIVLGTRESLEKLKRRLRQKKSASAYGNPQPVSQGEPAAPPLLKADIILSLPNIVIKPSLEEVQQSLYKVCHLLLKNVIYRFNKLISTNVRGLIILSKIT